jgi:hypothetical protein
MLFVVASGEAGVHPKPWFFRVAFKQAEDEQYIQKLTTTSTRCAASAMPVGTTIV